MTHHDMAYLAVAVAGTAILVSLYAIYLQQSRKDSAAYRDQLLDVYREEARALHATDSAKDGE